MHYNWLNGKRRAQVVASTFAQAVSQLAKRYKNNSPATWLSKDVYEHYQRLNGDLPEDMVSSNMCASAEQSPFGCQQFMDPRYDSHFPGDLPDQIYMDRGTYNHVVQYMNPPTGSGGLAASAVRAGSVIPRGQSGFIAPWGQESTHYRDHAALYLNWVFKPMPRTEPQAMHDSHSVA